MSSLTQIPRRRRRWRWLLRALGLYLAVEFLFDLLLCGGTPGAMTLFAYAGAYNSIQSIRASIPTPARLYRQRMAQGPPPDARVVNAGNTFGLKLLRTLATQQPGRNVFFSPYSVTRGLTMTCNGASGYTRAAMETALGLKGLDIATTNAAYNRMDTLLRYTDPRIQVHTADSVWADDEAQLRPEYVDAVSKSFGAQVEILDLQSSSAPGRINDWIRDRTDGLIRGGQGPFGPLDRCVLVDALTFHGEWKTKLKKANTHPGRFLRADGSDVTVPMMAGKMDASVWQDRDFTAARLPYADGSMSMILLVPRAPDGLPAFIQGLTPERWAELMARLDFSRESGVRMPRFRIAYATNMNDALKSAGLRLAFDRDRADFRAISDAPGGLYLSRVEHRALLDVDEEGTTAAAVTIQVMTARGRAAYINVDRPFFCAIRDDRTGSILFAGTIYDPSLGG